MKKKNWLSALLVVMMLVSMMTHLVLPAAAEITTASSDAVLILGEATTVSSSENGGNKTFIFIPETSGYYKFYSTVNSFDTYATLYDENMRTLVSNDDGGSNHNFMIYYRLLGGEAYYLNTRPYSSSATYGSYKVVVEGPSDWNYNTYSGKATITGYGGQSSKLTIPSTLGGCTVTSIQSSVFANNTDLTSVVVPEGVVSIGGYAFQNCVNLTSITLPSTLTSVGVDAFKNCDNLKEVCISDLSKWCGIGFASNYSDQFEASNPLHYAKDLYLNGKLVKDLVIPDGVTKINNYVFQGCACLTSVTIPASVTSIGKHAFLDCTNLKTVSFSNGITSIGNSAFYNCSALTSVTIPNSVSVIGGYAFCRCTALERIELPDNNFSIGRFAFFNTAYYNDITNWDGYVIYLNDYLLAADEEIWGSYTVKYGTKKIAEYAFYQCNALNSVTIPESVTSIGSNAFAECYNLSAVHIANENVVIGSNAFPYSANMGYLEGEWSYSVSGEKTATVVGYTGAGSDVVIPEELGGYPVVSVGNSAFAGRANLTSVTIPSGVRSIGSNAFDACINLVSVTIPDSVTTIDSNAFRDCAALATVTIPDSVTTIGSDAFYNCDALTAVTIPNSVTTIGSYAFYNCDALTAVTIPNSVTTIGSNTFRDCDALTTVTIPDSVTTISRYAFCDCDALTAVTIPDSVTSIGSYAFAWCYNLKSVYINDLMRWCAISFEDSTANPLCNNASLYLDGRKVTALSIPEEVTAIRRYTFYNCGSIHSVIIPETVTSVAINAFGSMVGIAYVYNPAINVAANAFASSTVVRYISHTAPWQYTISGEQAILTAYQGDATDVVIPSFVTENGKEYPVTALGNGLFKNDVRLNKITIPDGVITIGDSAFFGCDALTSVTIPDSVATIGYNAFYGCTNLQKLILPEGMTFNGSWDNLNYVLQNEEIKITGCHYGVYGDVIIPEYILGYPVTAIGDWAFEHADMTAVVIPDSVTTIGSGAFCRCYDLTTVVLSDNLISVGDQAFANSSIMSVEIPDSVTTIGYASFYNCDQLKEIMLSKNVEFIGEGAFWSCDQLSIAYVLNKEISVTRGDWSSCMFSYNTQIRRTTLDWDYLVSGGKATLIGYYGDDTAVMIPATIAEDGVTYPVVTLGTNLFYGNHRLTSAIIPDSVTQIGNSAFSNCTGLASVKLSNCLTAIGSEAFYNCNNLTSLTIPDSVVSIARNAFIGCTNLQSVELPDELVFVGVWNGLIYELQEKEITICGRNVAVSGVLTIPESVLGYPVTAIGNNVFEYSGITAVNLPTTITTIGNWAFNGCSSLESIVIPDSVTVLGAYSFKNCTALSSVVVGDNAVSFGAEAFKGTAYYNNKANWNEDGVLYIGNHLVEAKDTLSGSYTVRLGTRSIAAWAFKDCKKLTEVVIPEGVRHINSGAFYDCVYLRNLYLPLSLEEIYTQASYNCGRLVDIYYAGTREEFKNVFLGEQNQAFLRADMHYSVPHVHEYGDYSYNNDATEEQNGTESAYCACLASVTREAEGTRLIPTVPYVREDGDNPNLAILHHLKESGYKVTKLYWGYAGSEKVTVSNWNAFTAAVPADLRERDNTPLDGEIYAMTNAGYYAFWVVYTDAAGKSVQRGYVIHTEGTLDENYGKPYLELDETGKVAWMNLNGTTVQKMYWGFIGDADYTYISWPEFKERIGNTYLPDYGVRNGEGYVLNEVGYYRFVIVYLDSQGQRQERNFTVKVDTPAVAPSFDNSNLSNVATFVNGEGYPSKVYYGYIGEENTKYIDFTDFRAQSTDFVTDFGPPAGKTYQLTKAGFWRFVVNYNVNGATKDAVYTVYVDEADLALGTPKVTQSGTAVTLDHNGATVTKMYIGYMGTDPVEVDSWADYTALRKSNTTYYGPKDGTTTDLGKNSGYYTVVVTYNTGGADQLAFFTFYLK